MQWQSLGVVTPVINEWRLCPSPSIGGETFRVKFLNLGLNPESRRWSSFAVIDSLFLNDLSGSSVRVWPSVENEVIFLPIPPEFKEAGWIVRDLRVKKFFRYRLGRINEPQWSIEVEEFIP